MDTILYNGNIHTMDPGQPQVQALAIRDGQVAATGTSEEMLALAGRATRLIDLQGALAVPGFNDSHLHLLQHAVFSAQCDLFGTASIDEIIGRMRAHLAEKRTPKGKWVIGRHWNQDALREKRFPTRQDLDNVSKEHPVAAFRTCLHIAALNTKALELLGFLEAPAPIPGGEFDVETGIFKEAATYRLLEAIQPASVAEIQAYLRLAGKELAQNGITSVQSDDFTFARRHEDVVAAYAGLARAGELDFRVYQQCRPPEGMPIEAFLAQAFDLSGCEHTYALGPVKLLADGSLGARTALLARPYHDDAGTRGMATYTQEALDDLVLAAHRAGRAVAVHAIGDGAIHMALDSIEKARAARPAPGIRHGIVHCQITDRPLLDRFAQGKILAYLQPIFLHADVHVANQRVGPKLAATSYAFKTMLAEGVPVSFGTDCPVEALDPMENLYCAVARKDLGGWPEGGFYPEERLTVDQALYAYTAGSAYCSGEEEVKGRLVPGQFADIAVLSEDIYTLPPDAIQDVTVTMTLMDGRVVWQA